MRAIEIKEFGGPDVMELVEVDVPEPGENEVLIRVERAGINYADTHQTENSYLAKYEVPLVPGTEAAGIVEKAGASSGFEEGQRVVAMTPAGGYAEYAVAPAALTFALPDAVDYGTALALLVQGLTAWHLYRTSGNVKQGESVVVVAAAGGVGSLAVQLGKPMGAGRVIALASSEEKRKLTLELGADVAVDPGSEDLNAALREANGGNKVDVVFEMAGGRIFDECLRALAPFGRLVTYGLASREPNQISNGTLLKRSTAVIGFWLMHCIGREGMMREPLEDLFERAARGELRAVVGGTYALSDVRQAHEDIKSRRTSGKLLLDPAR